jgi:hypothetical protein
MYFAVPSAASSPYATYGLAGLYSLSAVRYTITWLIQIR